jgi:hypothetical protein
MFKKSVSSTRGRTWLLRRVIIAFGLWYFFCGVFYFDFIKDSFRMVSQVSSPAGLVLIPIGILLLICGAVVSVILFTRELSDYSFVKWVVLGGTILNLSTLFAIGFTFSLTWVSVVVAVGLLIATWTIDSHQVFKFVYVCGTLGAVYAGMDQALWVWSQSHRFPAIKNAIGSHLRPDSTDSIGGYKKPPSIYVVVMEELALSLVNTYANFLSLPNLSKIARAGIYFPRGYAVIDGTIWSMPSVFTGRYPSPTMLSEHDFALGWLKQGRNLLTDLIRQGYQLKIYNDLFGICTELPCSHLEIRTGSSSLIASKQLAQFAIHNLMHYQSFGVLRRDVISGLMQGQPERVFELGHSRDQPQLVYIHLFDSHHNYKRNRDGSIHNDPHQTFRGVSDEDAKKVADNYFEQILWADKVAGPLIDDLLKIPAEERILVFFSDHGLSWREPPYYRETGWLNSAQVNVPVAIVAPGIEPGLSSELFPLVDIYPTLIDLLNRRRDGIFQQPETLDGFSLFESASTRRDRVHYAFSLGCKYRLASDIWLLAEKYEAEASGESHWRCSDGAIPAKELALNLETADRIIAEARDPKPIPVLSSDRLGLRPQPPIGPMEREIVHMEEEGYLGYNILRYRGVYYGIPQSEGEFIYQNFLAGDYQGAVSGKTVDEVRKAVANLTAVAKPVTLVDEGFLGYNLIQHDAVFYGIQQGDGEFDYAKFQTGHYKEAFQDASLDALKRKIAQKHRSLSDNEKETSTTK